jgi:predicted acetyltransferase
MEQCFRGTQMELIQATTEHLPSYAAALRAGWSADTARSEAAKEELDRVEADPNGFLKSLYDPEAAGDRIKLPDGSMVERIPGYVRWMWDGEFCGSIGLRWVNGTETLPPTCLGHIGYAVVPWKQRLGYATHALKLLLPEAKVLGLRFVVITTDLDNLASQRVIAAAGGVLTERFTKLRQNGGGDALRFRIDL